MGEVARKLAMTQVDHERTTEKCKEAEVKCDELEKELNVVGANMKTLELSETNALKRHEDAEEKIRDLILNLKFTEIQAAAAERVAAKLQQELDLLVTDLNEWKEKYGEICVELEQTFNEMAGYYFFQSLSFTYDYDYYNSYNCKYIDLDKSSLLLIINCIKAITCFEGFFFI